MFEQCYNLTSLDENSFNMSNVVNMGYMFYSHDGAKIKEIENFDTSKVTYMDAMFQNTTKLKHIYIDSKWTTATDMFTDSEYQM